MSHREKSLQYWQEILKDFAASGLKASEYAKQHKVSKASLYKWRKHSSISLDPKELCKEGDQEVPLSFIEMQDFSSSPYTCQASLKLEFCGEGRPIIRADLTGEWEQVTALLKALAF